MKKLLGIICVVIGFGLVLGVVSSAIGILDTFYVFLFAVIVATALVVGVYLII